jgi:hypothetical protein
MDSDGVLYGFDDGASRCSKNTKDKTIKPLEQDFRSYEKWAMGEEPIDDTTEYAVTEISGIDWSLHGPNQGPNDRGSMYFPGGHFLGISCFNAAVNTKSCVNLSRICEVGMMMSQRQSKVSFKELPDGSYTPEFKYLIPSGFIAKDEMSDNNFRNIFATLNYNRLKTKKNIYGLREYDFISLQPINLNGEFKNKINNKKYNVSKNDNPDVNTTTNAKAYIRTIEENSQDYVLFRFGIDGKNKKLKSRFLVNDDGRYASLPDDFDMKTWKVPSRRESLTRSTNFAEEFRLYESLFAEHSGRTILTEKNNTDFINAKMDFETEVEKVSKGKSLTDIAGDLVSLLRSTISEYKVFADKDADHQHSNVGNASKKNFYEAKAKQILNLYVNLIKTLKKPNNFNQAQISIENAASSILGDYSDRSSSYKKIEQYSDIMLKISEIEADKKVKAEALKEYHKVIITDLTDTYKLIKSGNYEALFN